MFAAGAGQPNGNQQQGLNGCFNGPIWLCLGGRYILKYKHRAGLHSPPANPTGSLSPPVFVSDRHHRLYRMADVITRRDTDYSQWYIDVIQHAKLADYSPVRGCMVIRPNGYELWENMRAVLDGMFKETGHRSEERRVGKGCAAGR